MLKLGEGTALKELTLTFLAVVVILGLVTACAGTVIFTADRLSCNARAEVNHELEFQWALLTGCLVKTPSGLWIHSGDMYLIEGVNGRQED